MRISFKLDTDSVASPEFLGSVVWAKQNDLLTDDEIVDVIADEIVSNVRVVEE